MTNAIVGNVTELIAPPHIENVQPKAGGEDFAGSLKKAVEKGEMPEKDAEKNEIASNHQDTHRKQVEKQDDAMKSSEKSNAKGKEDTSSWDEKKAIDSKEKDSLPKEEAFSEMEEIAMTAVLNTQSAAFAPNDETVELVTESIDQILENVSDALGISMEDVQKAIENLGFSSADLFVSENMTQIFSELTGVEDSISLVMDENLYQTWQDLSESTGKIVANLEETLELLPEEVLPTVQAVEDAMQPVDVNAVETLSDEFDAVHTNGPIIEVTEETNIPKDIQKADTKDGLDMAASFENGKQVEKVDEETLVVEENKDASSDFSNQATEKESVKTVGMKRGGAEERTPMQTNVSTENLADFNTQNKILWNQAETPQAEALETMSHEMRTEEIADQILEYMKVQMNEDVKELEMQLHPASLGNVHVSIVSREGNITAQFTAQNEAVKAVMETQLVQLKEQFEEQGIKVDAVEVAVSNHQFEKQPGGDEQRESQRNDRSKVRTRRINLDELSDEDLDKLLTDEELLQADMMKKNGNTVDFTA